MTILVVSCLLNLALLALGQTPVRTIDGVTVYLDGGAFFWRNSDVQVDADGCANAYNAADTG
jgi:hypothetical protein